MSSRAQFVLALFVTLVLAPLQSLAQSTAMCPDAVQVDLETSDSWTGHDAFETRTFRLVVPAAGHLLVDVAPLDAAVVEPKLVLLGQDCRGGEKASIRSERRIASAVVAVDPGDFYFSVSAQDPASSLSSYVLRTRFAEQNVLPNKDLSDTEADPDLSTSGALVTLCRSGARAETDDVFSCADSLEKGRIVEGSIAGRPIADGWEIDHDVLTFTLTQSRTFEIRAVAELGLSLALYDRQGHRLATAETAEKTLRLAGTLGSGRYFLRIAGPKGTESLYSLAFETLEP